jgi:hypothetical protein
LLELILVDHPRVVLVIGAKDILPSCDILPHTWELVEVSPSLFSQPNIETIDLTVTRFYGVHVLLDSAC